MECGFLTMGGNELAPWERSALCTTGSKPFPEVGRQRNAIARFGPYDLTCAEASLEGIQDELKRARTRCPGFFAHETGFSPQQHLDLQQKARDNRLQMRIGI
jgi:hypothetical protein